jgi:hypothetical protein
MRRITVGVVVASSMALAAGCTGCLSDRKKGVPVDDTDTRVKTVLTAALDEIRRDGPAGLRMYLAEEDRGALDALLPLLQEKDPNPAVREPLLDYRFDESAPHAIRDGTLTATFRRCSGERVLTFRIDPSAKAVLFSPGKLAARLEAEQAGVFVLPVEVSDLDLLRQSLTDPVKIGDLKLAGGHRFVQLARLAGNPKRISKVLVQESDSAFEGTQATWTVTVLERPISVEAQLTADGQRIHRILRLDGQSPAAFLKERFKSLTDPGS